jgi:excisionase family DNA binding protein
MTKVNEYLKVAEAAKLLGISQGTLRAWAETGKILMHKNPINGYRLFKRSDLEGFLERMGRPVNSRQPRA